MAYHGALGSSVVKVFDATAASTGLTETAARAAGFDTGVAVMVKDHHAGYFPGAKELVLKLVYDRSNARLLGAQAFGEEGVEKRIDALAVALHGKMTLTDLAEIDFAYSPPYSSANDPINLAAFVGLNDLSGFSPLVTAPQVKSALGLGGRASPGAGRAQPERIRGLPHQGSAPHSAGRAAVQPGGCPAGSSPLCALPVGFPLPPGGPYTEGKRISGREKPDRRVPHGARAWRVRHRRVRLGRSYSWLATR